MNFPGFSSVQTSTTVDPTLSASATPKLSNADADTFAEIALGLINAPTASTTSPAGVKLANNLVNDNVAAASGTAASGTAASGTAASGTAASGTAASGTAAPAASTVTPAASNLEQNSAAGGATSGSTNTGSTPTTTATPPAPVVLTQGQTDTIFGSVLTPAQYLNNIMARIQTGSPVPGNTPLTVSQTLTLALNESYSTPESPYLECSDPTAAAQLVARIAGPNANVMVPNVAGMSQPPSAPAGWVGDYTIGYTTQSSGFNDSAETFTS